MGQRLVEVNLYPGFSRKLIRHPSKNLLVMPVPCPQENKLSAPRKQVLHCLFQKVKTLLRCQTRDHSNERNIGITVKVEDPLQI